MEANGLNETTGVSNEKAINIMIDTIIRKFSPGRFRLMTLFRLDLLGIVQLKLESLKASTDVSIT